MLDYSRCKQQAIIDISLKLRIPKSMNDLTVEASQSDET